MYEYNPKCEGSGIITCTPQVTLCPRGCADCYAVAGRCYTDLPNIPSVEQAKGRIVRMNDASDSYNQFNKVMATAALYNDVFLNTSYSELFTCSKGCYGLDFARMPVVLTVNPGEMTDTDFHKLDPIPENLMFVRVRVNMWNLELVNAVVEYYTKCDVEVILTWLAYYETPVPEEYKEYYEFRKRILNDYWCIKPEIHAEVEHNPLVYICGRGATSLCKDCGNCLRNYYKAKERLRSAGCE